MRTESVSLPAAARPRPGIVIVLAVVVLLLALAAGVLAAILLGGVSADAGPATQLAPFRWGPAGA